MSSVSDGARRQESLEWAAELLGVAPDCAAAERTIAFLRRVAEEDFVPPPPLALAWDVFHDPATPPPTEVEEAARDRFAARIAEFTAQFFLLGPAERAKRWQMLHDDAPQWPVLQARLDELKPGLGIDVASIPAEPPELASLAGWAVELAVLRGGPRAARRREIMGSLMVGNFSGWQATAGQLRRRHPQLASLAPDLIEPLVGWKKIGKLVKRNRRTRQSVVRLQRTSSGRANSRFGGSGVGAGVAIMIVVSSLFRAATNDSNRSQQYHPYQTPSPQFDPPPFRQVIPQYPTTPHPTTPQPASEPPSPTSEDAKKFYDKYLRSPDIDPSEPFFPPDDKKNSPPSPKPDAAPRGR